MPENKFSKALPELSDGKLGSMEISSSGVTYEIENMSKDSYENYIQLLKNEGYIMQENGSFVKDNYEIITAITDDGHMNINLKAN